MFTHLAQRESAAGAFDATGPLPSWWDQHVRQQWARYLLCPVPALTHAFGDFTVAPADRLTIGQLLRQERPSIDSLNALKALAKCQHRDRACEVAPEASLTAYYAAIAAALVRHHSRITRLDHDAIRTGLNWAARHPWLDPSTEQLLLDGLRHLRLPRSLWRH